jgi:hypothetical protein
MRILLMAFGLFLALQIATALMPAVMTTVSTVETAHAETRKPLASIVQGTPRRTVVVGRLPANLRPAHEAILRRAGKQWVDYVAHNIDWIAYEDAPRLQTNDGRDLVGQAVYERGRRIARVATGDMDGIGIAVTIVHEAAHLEGVRVTGLYYGEDYAKAKEREFQRALR